LISDPAQGINSFFGVPLHRIAEDAIITSARICAANLARFKCPRLIRFVDALPRNATGKIHKPTLPKNFSTASATDLAQAKAS